jgi:hypothetical protein
LNPRERYVLTYAAISQLNGADTVLPTSSSTKSLDRGLGVDSSRPEGGGEGRVYLESYTREAIPNEVGQHAVARRQPRTNQPTTTPAPLDSQSSLFLPQLSPSTASKPAPPCQCHQWEVMLIRYAQT